MTPAPRPGTSPPATGAAAGGDVATLLRRALLVLAAAGAVGTAVELAMLRHWTSPVQLIPWVALVVLAAAVAALVRPARPSTLRAVRVAAIAVTVAALIGVVEHVLANHEAGPLDFRYASTWARLSPARRWWLSATGGVGPSPSLAPLVLVQSAVCLWLATIGHPARPARWVAEAAPAAGHRSPAPLAADGG